MNAPSREVELQTWFSVSRNTYAVIDGHVVPNVVTMLPDAGLREWGRLQRGASPSEGADAWCAQLAPALALSRWLLAGEGAMLEDWGVLVFSDSDFRDVREHLRGLLQIELARRERVVLRWYKPSILCTLLPLLATSQLAEFFGPITAFAAGSRDGWTWLRLREGQLESQMVAMSRPEI